MEKYLCLEENMFCKIILFVSAFEKFVRRYSDSRTIWKRVVSQFES